MCFEKAGDAHREKLARAAGLVATANRVISTNLELGKASLQTASEIYESIGMHEKAATCYIKLGDYKKAGPLTLHKFQAVSITSGIYHSITFLIQVLPKELPYK